jgi:hypothetical protein
LESEVGEEPEDAFADGRFLFLFVALQSLPGQGEVALPALFKEDLPVLSERDGYINAHWSVNILIVSQKGYY